MAENESGEGGALPVASAAGGGVGAAGARAIALPANPYVEGLGRLSIPRQLGVILGLAASVALAVWLVLWSREPDMRPLYGSLERLDAPAVVDVLEANDIRYRIDAPSGALLVESAKIHEARLKLAEAGMPGEGAVGFELLDQEQALGTSQFMETARYRRSLEGELARTIASITSVKGARVHLAIPERSVFVRDQRKPSASVLLEVVSGRVVEEGQVRAIGNLVASSVPELQLSAVTIVDQKGKLLSNFTEDAQAREADRQLDYTARLEQQLVQRVHRILDPIVGTGRYKAEVTADVDFTAVEQADEIYNPDLPAIRSEQRLDEERVPGDAGAGIPGALSNQPPLAGESPEVAAAGEAAAGSVAPAPRNVRTQSTRNYELDRTLSYTRHQVGRLRRLSVAVVLDDQLGVDPETGERQQAPWDAETLARITTLVRDAVGYDAGRGDSVNVVNATFFVGPVDESAIPEPPFWERNWFVPLLKQLLGILIALLVVVVVLRPVLRSLSSNVKQLRALEERHRSQREAEAAAKAGLADEELLKLPGPGREYERRLAAVNRIVENDAERVAQVVRRWVREGD